MSQIQIWWPPSLIWVSQSICKSKTINIHFIKHKLAFISLQPFTITQKTINITITTSSSTYNIQQLKHKNRHHYKQNKTDPTGHEKVAFLLELFFEPSNITFQNRPFFQKGGYDISCSWTHGWIHPHKKLALGFLKKKKGILIVQKKNIQKLGFRKTYELGASIKPPSRVVVRPRRLRSSDSSTCAYHHCWVLDRWSRVSGVESGGNERGEN